MYKTRRSVSFEKWDDGRLWRSRPRPRGLGTRWRLALKFPIFGMGRAIMVGECSRVLPPEIKLPSYSGIKFWAANNDMSLSFPFFFRHEFPRRCRAVSAPRPAPQSASLPLIKTARTAPIPKLLGPLATAVFFVSAVGSAVVLGQIPFKKGLCRGKRLRSSRAVVAEKLRGIGFCVEMASGILIA